MIENKSPVLQINKLILVGREKNYSVSFSNGLNIIYGDSDTGKSSILNLIDYLLGGSKVYLYDEIEMHGDYALMEVNLNGEVYTVKRDIFKPTDDIEVYHSTIENIHSVFPQEYSSSYSKEGPAGYYSEFLLNALNIPVLKVKQAPSKADSKMTALSFRDIFKFCYLDQDEVGSKDILDQKNFSVFVKNKETFKFIHNLLDSQITELQEEIAEKIKNKKDIENKYSIISTFLRDARLESIESLEDNLSEIKEMIRNVDEEIAVLNQRMMSNTKQFDDLREVIILKQSEHGKLSMQKVYLESQLEQNIRLRNDYLQDIQKLTSSLEVIKKLPNHEHHHVNCPVCDNLMNAAKFNEIFNQYDSSSIEQEIKSLKNRNKELNALIDEQRNSLLNLSIQINEINEDLNKAKGFLDIQSNEYLSPYISERDIFNSRKGELNEELKRTQYLLKLRNQLNELIKKGELLSEQITDLTSKLELLIEGAPSIEMVLQSISDNLNDFLNFIPIRNAYGIDISQKTFLPVVRGRNYSDLTSGGLRTLVSIGYLFSLLRNSLGNHTNYPSLIMIDTIGKYIGKTKPKYLSDTNQQEDKKEGLDDPHKYKNIYNYLTGLNDDLATKYKFQVIVVDNDLPEDLATDLQKHVVKRFNVDNLDGYEIGFIDNAKPKV